MSALFPTYQRWDLEITHGEGAWVTASDGKRYLDFIAGIAVCNLGHRHPKVLEAVHAQLDQVWHVSNLFQNSLQEEVAERLVQHSSGDRVFFCNSGAEANEAAIKLARKATGKWKIITFEQSFHGRTFATMAATGQDKVKVGYGPMLPTFVYVPYNDVEQLQQAMDQETAAIMLEVIQGEGGVNPGDPSFIQAAEQLCREYGALLIVDEVQTGIGRTGKPFAYQHYGISPDIISVAKGLGNGFPVGAVIGKEQLLEDFGPGSHGSTFGGNPLAMAAANATLQVIFEESFLQDVVVKGEYLKKQLEARLAGLPGLQEIRGQGLILGIETSFEVAPLLAIMREKQLLTLGAGPHVIRLLPPIIVSKEEIDEAVDRIMAAWKEYMN